MTFWQLLFYAFRANENIADTAQNIRFVYANHSFAKRIILEWFAKSDNGIGNAEYVLFLAHCLSSMIWRHSWRKIFDKQLGNWLKK